MIIDMWQPLINPADDKPLKNDMLAHDGEDLRLCDAIGHALLNANFPDEMNTLTAEDKVARFFLARKCYRSPRGNFTIEELALMKKVVGRCYVPLIVGPVFEALENGANAGDSV